MKEVLLPYGEETLALRLPDPQLLDVLSPRSLPAAEDAAGEIRRALANPIAAQPLAQAARGSRRVVILADDMTRQTPLKLILPELLAELKRAGVGEGQVQVVIALGTHRPMTPAEIEAHFGAELVKRVEILNHPWQDPAQMANLGVTANGTPVQICRLALESDFLIGLGSIVPHHIPGYSGGAKIIQPGISGAATTGATHFLSTRTRRSYLGLVENTVREEMEQIAGRVGLKAILNVVLDPAGRLMGAVYGDFRQAHRAGIGLANEVYGAPFQGQAEIVVAGSHPCDIEFWQAHKSLYPADMLVKPGGSIIVVTPCPEGVAVMHREMLEYTAQGSEQVERLILAGEIRDVASGALALAWAKVRERASVSLVSAGISRQEAKALGFARFDSLEEALAAAQRSQGAEAKVSILTHAPDTLPFQRRA